MRAGVKLKPREHETRGFRFDFKGNWIAFKEDYVVAGMTHDTDRCFNEVL